MPKWNIPISAVEPHYFDTAPAPAPALLHTKPTFLKQTMVNIKV
jgi:hypothetical protein